MASPKGVWGIDIGQCALKALRVELIDGVATATAFDYVEHPKILSQPDADPDQLTREALDQFLSRNTLKGDLVAIAVPGQSGLARFVKLPPVEEKKIGDIVKFEAKQQIPFPLEEVVWDFQKIGSGQVTDGFALETEIGLFAMKRDIIARQMQHYRDVGIEVDIIQMTPLALCNFVGYEMLGKGGTNPPVDPEDDTPKGKRKCAVGLDIGADASNLVVTDGDKIIWQRPIPLGGNHLTRALSKELKLTFAKAEHLKRNAAKSPPDLKQILAALKPVLTDLVGEVQRSLGYFTNSHREAHVAYLVGLGSAFRLPGLQKYLSEKLQIDVRKPTKFNRLAGDEVAAAPVFNENLLSFAPVYGLCVQGLSAMNKQADVQHARLTTNLLPPEIRTERLIKQKKPWAVTAAAGLFAGVGIMTAGYAWGYKAVDNAAINQSMKEAEAALSRVSARQNEVSAKEKEVATTYDAVLSIVAGKDEQLNWIRIVEQINKCLPRPDGKNLPLRGDRPKPGGKPGEMEPNQTKYWTLDLAREAFQDYMDRVRGGESSDAPVNETLRENLCRVDIEAIHSYYVPDLRVFYDTAKKETAEKTGKEFDGMLAFDVNEPPKAGEGGWVIALHGYTYQKDGAIFLRDTLVHNLAMVSGRNLPLPGAAATPSSPAAETPSGGITKVKEDPIKDRISHAFLYNCWTIPEPKPGVFEKINENYLRRLAAGPAADPSPQGGGGGGASGSPRDGWQPLAGTGGGASGGGTAAPAAVAPPIPVMGRGGGRGGEVRLDGPRPGGSPVPAPAPAPGAAPAAPGTPENVRAKPRYEFVVMFIWREPTPSDKLVIPAQTPSP
jgi:type IV pilus assembly protein PilM